MKPTVVFRDVPEEMFEVVLKAIDDMLRAGAAKSGKVNKQDTAGALLLGPVLVEEQQEQTEGGPEMMFGMLKDMAADALRQGLAVGICFTRE